MHGRPEGEQGGANALPGFGHLVKHLVKILTICVIILTLGQNTNICSPKKFAPPTKTSVDAHVQMITAANYITQCKGKLKTWTNQI